MSGTQNHYEINVALNGKHCFATASRSCVTEDQAKFVYIQLGIRFPASEGFKVTCKYYECSGKLITF